MSESVDRARVIFSGTVQGVGFRYTTRRLAGDYPELTGIVRNLPDGTVELIAEGPRAKVQALTVAVNERMAGYIAQSDIAWSHSARAYHHFGIAH